MKAVPGLGPVTSSSVIQPSPLAPKVTTVVRAMAMAKPPASVRLASLSRENRRRTSATPSAATAPNSGPSTIAPITRIWESSTIAMVAIRVARVMKLTYVQFSSESS